MNVQKRNGRFRGSREKAMVDWVSRCVLLLGILPAMLVSKGMAEEVASVTREAEAGTLGADWSLVSGTPDYITIGTDFISTGNPGSDARVATYSVTFPSAGTYNLFLRMRTGPGDFNDDSFFYGNGFGVKSPTADADWIMCNNTVDGGFNVDGEVVTGAGSAGGSVWKWVNLSEYTGDTGETPITFAVPEGGLTQTFQLGAREDGLEMDRFVFGRVEYAFTVADLDAGTTPEPPPQIGRILNPEVLGGGDLLLSYYGHAGRSYAAEWTHSLTSEVSWAATVTNTADPEGLVMFTRMPLNPAEFCRVRDVTLPYPVSGLTASAGNTEVLLNWVSSAFATSYNVKTSLSDGGPYQLVTNVTENNVLFSGLTNDTTYYYVASSQNEIGESPDSPQVSAMPSTNATLIPPLVYAVENTGADYPEPPLPIFNDLPVVQPLTDPFMWSATDPYNWTAPTGRSTRFSDWSRRRSEIMAEIEHYEIGMKPAVNLDDISAGFSGNTLTVVVTNPVNGRRLTLTSTVSFPPGSGPHPLIIGMNSPNGSISLGGRPIATMNYAHDQVTTYYGHSNADPYYVFYQNLGLNVDNTGQYSAWAWGCSRLIDGLYKLEGNLGGTQIDLERIAVTGCSYAGKMALFCGAFDERIALTIPQESGGGGAPNWRYSATEPDGTVEGLGQTDSNWFKNDMFQYAGPNTQLLPHDHHELLALVAPRALFATGNPDGATWLSNPSCYVSCKAVERVYEQFGVPDRFGYNILGGAGHCGATTDLYADVGAFLDRFLLGITNVNTTIRHIPSAYASIDADAWTDWWGSTNPVLTGASGATFTNTYEAECATVGADWDILTDGAASNGKYVTVTPGVQSLSAAPSTAAGWITIPFNVPADGQVAVFARLNCPSADDDSFWVRFDGGSFTMLNGLANGGNWTWVRFGNPTMTAGAHTLTVGYREDGARLDKVSVSDYLFQPSGTGQAAENLCP